MVTLESNRTQPSTTAPYERQTVQPTAEAVAEQPQAEQRTSIAVRDPLWFVSLVVAGATIGSMWGLSTLIVSILGLSGVLPIYMLPVAGITLGMAFLMLGTVGTAWARMFGFAEHETSRDRLAFLGGLAAVLIAGLFAVVLGILNFVFLGDARFVAVAVIALGLGLLWHSWVMRRVSHFTHYVTYHGTESRLPSGPFAIIGSLAARNRECSGEDQDCAVERSLRIAIPGGSP
jgi:hypothetical protein